MTVTGGVSSTAAMGKGVTESQFGAATKKLEDVKSYAADKLAKLGS